LASLGHRVTVALLSYADEAPVQVDRGGVVWYSESLRPLAHNLGASGYLGMVERIASEFRPDWVVGYSDTWYGILAQHVAERHGCMSLIDAYDNYESYMPLAKPLHWLWRRALRRATALSAAGPQLLELMGRGRSTGNMAVVSMAADPDFMPMDRDACRARLGLPAGVPLLGYVGSLHRSRGVNMLFQVVERVRRQVPEVRLVVSGHRQHGLSLPETLAERMIDLGYLDDEAIPSLVNAVDVSLVVNRHSAFGDYSYPVKIYEAMRCGTPVVATAVPGTAWVLRNHPECLAAPDNTDAMAAQVEAALRNGRVDYGTQPGWGDSAGVLAGLLAVAGERLAARAGFRKTAV
jgi:glycosyltransferase involved in cell wall biosynthesis